MEFGLDTPKEVVPLAWLVGRWVGVGVMALPEGEDVQFGQEVVFAHNGEPMLQYESRLWELSSAGERVRLLGTETGFWRIVVPDDLEAAAKAAAGVDVVVALAHSAGYTEMYAGRSGGGKIELASQGVTAGPGHVVHEAAERMYGLVQGDLLWVQDVSRGGEPMRSLASARLKKAPEPSQAASDE